MYAPLQAAIARYVDLTDGEWQALFSLFSPLHAPKGTRLVDLGAVATHMYFIQKGAVCKYYRHRGIALHSGFYLENTFVTVLTSFLDQTPAKEVVETLEDSTLLCLEQADYDLMNEASVKINCFTRPLTENWLVELHQQASLLNAPPRQRVRYLLRHQPEWLQRIPSRYLASFLDLPVALFTRILQGLQKK